MLSCLLTKFGMLHSTKKDVVRDTNYKKGAVLSHVTIHLRGVPEWMILRDFHKSKMACKSGKEHRPKGLKVVSVEYTGTSEEVYCVTVKDGPSEFTLEGFIGTGNCISCCKGGMGYFNHVRKVFPEEFQKMALLEREIGHACLKEPITIDGKLTSRKVFLDELDPERGRHEPMYVEDCGSTGEICEIALMTGKAHFDDVP